MKHQGTKRLETRRLILRPLTAADAPSMYRNWASDDEVTRYLTWPTHVAAEDTVRFVDWCLDGYRQPSAYLWGIEMKDSGQLVGTISAVKCQEAIDEVELGWALGRAWWGQGIMPEAAEEVVRFFFEEVGAHRVCAAHDTNNAKSGRVMQKIGMRHEGTLRAAGRNNQGIVDMDVYAILREDRKK